MIRNHNHDPASGAPEKRSKSETSLWRGAPKVAAFSSMVIAVLIGASILLTANERFGSGINAAETPENDIPVIQQRSLVFAERDDGAFVVRDVNGDRQLAMFDPEGASIIRGVFKDLAFGRNGTDMELPYQLNRYADGHLAILDPVSGLTVDLDAVGIDNARAFAALL
ncbi:MAG: photosynthetic complex assembly protein PuhC, partial [Pseudomonadota bacterium]